MANKLTDILRKVFLSSLTGIAASNTSSANIDIGVFEPTEVDKKVESHLDRKPELVSKLILKKTSNNEWAFLSHRSHRSHSSHRSHYSSYSRGGGGGSNYSTPSNNSGSSDVSPKYNSIINSGTINNGGNSTALHLGARTLRKGMSGTDVTELVNILLWKGYLKMENGAVVVTGISTFDEILERAVKKFQLDNGLKRDGICGPVTTYYLKNK